MRAWQRLRQVLASQASSTPCQLSHDGIDMQARAYSQLLSLHNLSTTQLYGVCGSRESRQSEQIANGRNRYLRTPTECLCRGFANKFTPGSFGDDREDYDTGRGLPDVEDIDLSSSESSEDSDAEDGGLAVQKSRQARAEETGLDHPLLRGFDTTTTAKRKFILGRILEGKEDVFGPPQFKEADLQAADEEAEFLSYFKMKVVDVNRTSRGSKTGGIGRFSALVVVGNSNGVLGLGMGKSTELPAAVQKANNQAMKTLFFVPRYRNATILHPVVGRYGKCKVIMYPRSTGSGCKASHMVTGICNLAGIQDIGVKVHGTRNLRNTVKALIRCFEAQHIPQEQALLPVR